MFLDKGLQNYNNFLTYANCVEEIRPNSENVNNVENSRKMQVIKDVTSLQKKSAF